ncbi:hypothetical protein [Sphingomonas jatrophae]|uniref:Uncharacterized protein n=1 Tax=Sphingomonas jatrophae TaxID=1166337 RepID=A0A1I6JDY3_9SPHN|nr:hypothetical protein [Sphingomonas jatrophae]SFR77198.1 hypothetical protein SAMN05192580_0158 [Sphingomonas jatrophae]
MVNMMLANPDGNDASRPDVQPSMQFTENLGAALEQQAERNRRLAMERLAVALITPDIAHAARLIDHACGAMSRVREAEASG